MSHGMIDSILKFLWTPLLSHASPNFTRSVSIFQRSLHFSFPYSALFFLLFYILSEIFCLFPLISVSVGTFSFSLCEESAVCSWSSYTGDNSAKTASLIFTIISRFSNDNSRKNIVGTFSTSQSNTFSSSFSFWPS